MGAGTKAKARSGGGGGGGNAAAAVTNAADEQRIAVITRDNIRMLRPRRGYRGTHAHDAAPPGSLAAAAVLTRDEVERIKSAAALAHETPEAQAARILALRAAEAEMALQRKLRLDEFERRRAELAPPSEHDAEERAQNAHLLDKARRQREEDETEIKRLNEMILDAKCLTVRNLQVKEKSTIRNAMRREDARLDAMMEAERQLAIAAQQEREAARVQEMRRGAQVIERQIKTRHDAAVLEAERRETEKAETMAAIRARNDADAEERAARQRAQRALMDEVARANREAISLRAKMKEADRNEDNRLLAYAIAKDARESALEKEAAARRAERERELAKLRDAQRRMVDTSSDQDALRARRAQEAHEREWRRKERDAAERKLREEEALKRERALQQLSRESAIAAEAVSLRNEFVENLGRQREVEERLAAEERARALRARSYCDELRSQISEKEKTRGRARAEFFADGIRFEQERREQARRIDAIRARKIKEAIAEGVPTAQCEEILRKAQRQQQQRAHMEHLQRK